MRLEPNIDDEYRSKMFFVLRSLGSHEREYSEWQPAKQRCWPLHSLPTAIVLPKRIHRIPADIAAEAMHAVHPPIHLPDPEIRSALMHFAYGISKEPHVTEAWSSSEEDATIIWAFIDEDTTEVRRSVFEAELETMEAFPDLEFDFYVFSSKCRDAFVDEQDEAERFYSRT